MKSQPLDALSVQQLPRQYPMAIFSTDEIKQEVKQFKRLLKAPPEERLDIEEFRCLMDDLCHALGPHGGGDTAAAWVQLSSEDQRQTLALVCDQVLAALADIPRIVGRDYDAAKTLLLPVSYAQRIELLFGKGALPIAWIRVLNVSAF